MSVIDSQWIKKPWEIKNCLKSPFNSISVKTFPVNSGLVRTSTHFRWTRVTGHRHLASGSNSVDAIINAVASGHFVKSSSKSVAPQLEAPIEDSTGGRRARGRRKRIDDTYWYDGDNIDNDKVTKKKKATPSRTTAKLKFTHNYEAVQKPKTHAPFTAPPFEDPDRLYCYCRCPYDEVSQMIGCDANDCPYEWFHFECVGISEAPEGQWYCPECRLRPKYRAQFDEPFFQPQPPPPPPQQII